jgi:hypothetical protein
MLLREVAEGASDVPTAQALGGLVLFPGQSHFRRLSRIRDTQV